MIIPDYRYYIIIDNIVSGYLLEYNRAHDPYLVYSMTSTNKHIDNFISRALAIAEKEAKEANAIGFMTRALVQATLPHSKTQENEFNRQNGNFRLTILSPSSVGLPYGNIPRLLMAWITTEAVRTKSPELILGKNLSTFMEQLGLIPTGGRWGTITRLKNQMKRLFSSSISCTYDDGESWAIKNIQPIEAAHLWWNPKHPDQCSLFESSITLGQKFFEEIIRFPVPINMEALKALKKSSLAIDIYCWLTYRLSYLKKSSTISWETLEAQFGSNYNRTRDFKKKFILQLKYVQTVYPDAKCGISDLGLILYPSQPHIFKRNDN